MLVFPAVVVIIAVAFVAVAVNTFGHAAFSVVVNAVAVVDIAVAVAIYKIDTNLQRVHVAD